MAGGPGVFPDRPLAWKLRVLVCCAGVFVAGLYLVSLWEDCREGGLTAVLGY